MYHRVSTGRHFLFTSPDTCCRMRRLAAKYSERIKKADCHQQGTSSIKSRLQFINTDADHGYSSQRSVAISYIVRSRIGYESNSK